MTEPTTRSGALTRKDIEELLAAHVNSMEKRGGSITLQDPRVSQLQAWGWATIGTAIVGVGLWLVTSVNTLNRTMERAITTNEFILRAIEEQGKVNEEQNRRLLVVERKP